MYYYKIGEIGISFNTSLILNETKKFSKYSISRQEFLDTDSKLTYLINEKELPQVNKNKIIYEGISFFVQQYEDSYIWFSKKGMLTPYYCMIENQEHINEEIVVSPQFKKELEYTSDFFEIMDITSALFKYRALIIHSSFIIYKNIGILFSGPSGIGKTTQSKLWEKYKNAEIINGDRSLIRKVNSIWNSFGIPFCGSSEICKNKQVKLGLIVILEKGNENKIKELTYLEKFKYILSEVGINKWNKNDIKIAMDIVEEIISEVNIVKLSCREEEESVNLVEKFLFEKGILKNE